MSRRAQRAELPAELSRGAVRWATFVRAEERPSAAWAPNELDDWRRIRAWRRWQDAVEQWGAGHDLDRAALMARGWWPSSPLALVS